MNLNPPTEHQLLVFWVSLLVILAVARLFGALMQRIGQPSVVGELAAGLIIGPSVLGRLSPDTFGWLFPDDDVQTGMLFTVGWIGVLLLLVATGFETDLGLIGRLGKAATFVSAGSLIVPAVAGFLVGWYIPVAFVGGETERYIFALFIAAALSISSLPVIAKILGEMGLMRRNFGQLTLAAGMANDVVGWIALGVIAGLAQAGGIKLDKLAITIGGLFLFFGLAFTLGQRVVDSSLRRVRANGDDPLSGNRAIRTAVNAAESFATKLGATHTTIVQADENVAARIVSTAKDVGSDIVILAGTSRNGGEDLFLGHTIHHALENLDQTVVIAVTPSSTPTIEVAADDVPVSNEPELVGV